MEKDKELNLEEAQKIYGYFDKSQLIKLFELILEGKENEVIKRYRKIYDQGIEPKVFINDFLELVYYFKNINSLTLESTNFSLNDDEFLKIKEISNKIEKEILILFWQFTLRTLEELDIVSNQNLSIEMFLTRLMYLSSSKSNNDILKKKDLPKSIENDLINDLKTEPINQIKNVSQEKKVKSELQNDVKAQEKIIINSFNNLLLVCSKKKEMKLKYELEKNVNLVSFEKNRIEISFNDNLDKNFVKDLSIKLFEWTDQRWIITLSKTKGEISIKEKEKNKKLALFEKAKSTNLYKSVIEKFPDANLIDVISNEKNEE